MLNLNAQEILDAYKLFCDFRIQFEHTNKVFVHETFLYPTTILAMKISLRTDVQISFKSKVAESYYQFITQGQGFKKKSYVALTSIPSVSLLRT